MNAQDRQFVRGVPRSFLWMFAIRLVMGLVLACSVALALWSYFGRLRPVTRQSQEKTSLMSSLANEVQQYQLNWDSAEANRTEQSFTAARARLFAGPTEAAGWQKEIQRQTVSLALEATTQLGQAEPQAATNQHLSLLPATLNILPATTGQRPKTPSEAGAAVGRTNSPYNRLLVFLRDLEKGNKRIDLVELVASGTSNSIDQARAVVHLWTQERSQK